MTRLIVREEIFRTFPDAILGVVHFQGINNRGESAEITAALRQEEAATPERFANTPINDHPHIAPWREAYRKFGAKPKDYPSSIENLVKRVIKGHRLPHINLLVDIYNTISLRHILPVGGEDLDRMEGDIELTFASADEPPVRMLGEPEARPPRQGEVIYKDKLSAICRRWNWKEADRTKFTDETTNGFLVIERLSPVDRSLLEQSIDELAGLVTKHCGGTAKTGTIDSSIPQMDL